MNILFLTIGNLENIYAHEIYPDLLRALQRQGHEIYAVCSRERRYGKPTELTKEAGIHILRVKTGNITQTNLLEKGLSTVTIGAVYRKAISRFLKAVKFDLILYSTPPITLASLIAKLRKKFHAKTYLMLKDIFPQNAVDTGVFGKNSPLYYYFRRKEKQLYSSSDFIGCMSPANCKYLLDHNPSVKKERVGLCPNSLELTELPKADKASVRKQYGISMNKTVFLYGGNLGIPQGVGFMLSCMDKLKDRDDVQFVIAGAGTEYAHVADFLKENQCRHVLLLKKLQTDTYNRLAAACDVGLIFLDHRFTIPNYPSRLLSYLQAGLPVLAATDSVTDIKDDIAAGDFGWWTESADVSNFCNIVDDIVSKQAVLPQKGKNGRRFLEENFDVESCAQQILHTLQDASCGEK